MFINKQYSPGKDNVSSARNARQRCSWPTSILPLIEILHSLIEPPMISLGWKIAIISIPALPIWNPSYSNTALITTWDGPHISHHQAVHDEDNDEDSHAPPDVEQQHDVLGIRCGDIIHSQSCKNNFLVSGLTINPKERVWWMKFITPDYPRRI